MPKVLLYLLIASFILCNVLCAYGTDKKKKRKNEQLSDNLIIQDDADFGEELQKIEQ